MTSRLIIRHEDKIYENRLRFHIFLVRSKDSTLYQDSKINKICINI